MFATGQIVLMAALVAAPAPAKPRDVWVGQIVCLKSPSPETYARSESGEFVLKRYTLRYLDMRVVEEKGEYVCLQHDDFEVWVKKEIALRPRAAIDHFTSILDKEPSNERALSCRCASYMAAGDHERALKDADEACRLSPDSVAWKNNRSEVYIKMKKYDKAITDLTEILTDSPGYYFALLNRSEAYVRTRQFDKAIADLNKAIATESKVPMLHMNLARCLATSPDAKVRNGKAAVESVTKALEMSRYKDGRLLDTAAAAYAELGNFERAIELQQKAFSDNEFMRDEGEAARKRLQLYRDKKPFRDE